MKTLSVTLAAVLLWATTAAAEAPRAVCFRTGSGRVAGRLEAIRDGRLFLRTDSGEQTHSLEDFREITLPGREPSPVRSPLRLHTRAGGVLMVRELETGKEPETVDLTGYGWRAAGLPLEQVAAVVGRRFLEDAAAPEQERLRQTRLEPPVGEDLLLLRGEQEATGCIVAGLGTEGPSILRDDERVTPTWDEVAWLVLSPIGPAESAGEPVHTVTLVHGSRLRVGSLELGHGSLTAKRGATSYTIEGERLQWMRVAPLRYRYLSDLPPAETQTEPWLDVVWPPRTDASVTGAPIRLGVAGPPAASELLRGARTHHHRRASLHMPPRRAQRGQIQFPAGPLGGSAYAKGIGTYPRTRLTWRLKEPYGAFHATVGVDDAAGRRGSVVFRVLVDGREAWASEPVSGADPSLEVAVPLNGSAELGLVTDFGAPLAAGEAGFADWAEARVVK
ncbi:MAG: NPCBM/NEW2 domain-containing protein [Candidatus Brocadiia bacterium]